LVSNHIDLRDLPELRRERLCLRLHREVLEPAFPLSAELEDAGTWLELMSRNPPSPAPKLHIIAAIADDEAVLGGVVCEFYRSSHAGLVTYGAVAPGRRLTGVGRSLMEAALEALARDAGSWPAPVFGEVEDPARTPPEAIGSGIDLRERLRALSELGFAGTDLPYVQPALMPGKSPVDWLRFLIHRTSMPAGARCIPASRVHLFLDEYYRSLGADPATNDSFAAMVEWLDENPEVALQPLVP